MPNKKVLVGDYDGSGRGRHVTWQAGDTLVDPDNNPIGGGGATTFLGLTDTPGAYPGAGQFVIVNGTNNGLTFAASGGGNLDQAYDFGGAGAGRAITVDSGAVQLNGTGNVLELQNEGRISFGTANDTTLGFFLGSFTALGKNESGSTIPFLFQTGASSTANSGDVVIFTGSASSGTSGDIVLQVGSGSTEGTIELNSDIVTVGKTGNARLTVGTMGTPYETLNVGGGIRLGAKDQYVPSPDSDGIIIWDGTATDFFGRKGGSWVSLTAGAGGSDTLQTAYTSGATITLTNATRPIHISASGSGPPDQGLLLDDLVYAEFGTTATERIALYHDAASFFWIASEDTTSSNSHAVRIKTGNTDNTYYSGLIDLWTGHVGAGAGPTGSSGAISLITGTNSGPGSSGNVKLQTGTTVTASAKGVVEIYQSRLELDAHNDNVGLQVPTHAGSTVIDKVNTKPGDIVVRTDTDTLYFRSASAWIAAGGGGGGNTLDQAYDQGGAHAGRQINIDTGFPVVLNNTATSNVLEAKNNGYAAFGDNQEGFLGYNSSISRHYLGTADNVGGSTVAMRLRTGNAGSGSSGGIEIQTGEATTSSGSIALSTGSGPTKGDVTVSSKDLIATLTGGMGVSVGSPTEKLEVAGAVAVGDAVNPATTANGVIRWSGSDFEGRKGGSWVSLTAGATGGEANTTSNALADSLPTRAGLAKAKVGIDLPFKVIQAGTGISLAADANAITINSTSSGLWTDSGVFTYLTSTSDNVVIGNSVQTGSERLQINGAITLGNAVGTTNGTIRWNGANFQGYNGGWVNLDTQGITNLQGAYNGGRTITTSSGLPVVISSSSGTGIQLADTGSSTIGLDIGAGFTFGWVSASPAVLTSTNPLIFSTASDAAISYDSSLTALKIRGIANGTTSRGIAILTDEGSSTSGGIAIRAGGNTIKGNIDLQGGTVSRNATTLLDQANGYTANISGGAGITLNSTSTGNIDLNTVTGDILLSSSSNGLINLDTNSGNIELTSTTGEIILYPGGNDRITIGNPSLAQRIGWDTSVLPGGSTGFGPGTLFLISSGRTWFVNIGSDASPDWRDLVRDVNNVGGYAQIAQATGNNGIATLRTIKAGAGITVNQNANDIEIVNNNPTAPSVAFGSMFLPSPSSMPGSLAPVGSGSTAMTIDTSGGVPRLFNVNFLSPTRLYPQVGGIYEIEYGISIVPDSLPEVWETYLYKNGVEITSPKTRQRQHVPPPSGIEEPVINISGNCVELIEAGDYIELYTQEVQGNNTGTALYCNVTLHYLGPPAA